MAARHELLGGLVQVYRRPESPHWNCSATVGGNQYRKSTKQEDLSLAKEFAEDWFLTLRGKEKFGGGLAKGKTFRKVAEKFLEEFEALTSGERSPKYIATLKSKIVAHLNPFFGDKAVSEITDSLIQDYRVHRARAVDKHGNPAAPARTTIHGDIITLRHVLKTAKRHGWITHLPDMSVPYKASGKVKHRAWFSPDEYKRLYEATRERALRPPNPKWKWECEQFHDYVLFMANTGLRPDEAARLEFRDVVIDDDELTGQRILVIRVRGKRGVGYCKSMPAAVFYFERLKNRLRAAPKEPPALTRDRRGTGKIRKARGTEKSRARGGSGLSRGAGEAMVKPFPSDLVFGRPQRELMNTVLDELKLKFDREKQRRTSYSLRHTYISFRLIEGADVYQVAKNCRTSVEMIEKYYASHIANRIDASQINMKESRLLAASKLGTLSEEAEQPSP